VYERVRDDVAAGTDSAEFRRSVLESRLGVLEASGGVSRIRDNLAAPLMILVGIVGLVLLVTCANVATLMLTRAVARRREVALCLALGAGRLRIIRQNMVEALLLAALGGLGGFLVAIWGTSALSSLRSGVLPVVLDIVLTGRSVFAGRSPAPRLYSASCRRFPRPGSTRWASSSAERGPGAGCRASPLAARSS
jgi:hypothetical protein